MSGLSIMSYSILMMCSSLEHDTLPSLLAVVEGFKSGDGL